MSTPPPQDSVQPPRRPSPRRRAGLGRPKVVAVAFAISAALHLAAILIYPTLFQREIRNPTPFVLPVSSERTGDMEVIQVVEVAPEDPDAPPAPDEVEDAPAPAEDVDAPVVRDEAERGGLVEPGPTAAERLRPDLRDQRLWGPVDPALTELTAEQRLELELAGELEAWRDSVRVAEARRAGLTDWTVEDGEGGRWGVSPGRIHLGSFSLPLPFGFGVNPGRRDEAAYRSWELEELQRQQLEGQVSGSWRERAEAIRARRDRERARADSVRPPGG